MMAPRPKYEIRVAYLANFFFSWNGLFYISAITSVFVVLSLLAGGAFHANSYVMSFLGGLPSVAMNIPVSIRCGYNLDILTRQTIIRSFRTRDFISMPTADSSILLRRPKNRLRDWDERFLQIRDDTHETTLSCQMRDLFTIRRFLETSSKCQAEQDQNRPP
ncbi:hypothetical protein [Gluconacetobacter asukensis]|uniref:Uncharacterized protein n=1 Tax=Gluconacetobacter asukensis TaxID=1017181 RepID=A0A7W4J107_9PROT|nr:hypothetical protein [Gluconacetobacter asukensis]MBB2172745.1 hypothetical protein [Gluconacetobacter asukensis]